MSSEDLKKLQRGRLHEVKSSMFLSTPKPTTFYYIETKFKKITRSSVGTVSRIYESGINDLMLQLSQILDEMVRNTRLSTVMLILSTSLSKHTFVKIKGDIGTIF